MSGRSLHKQPDGRVTVGSRKTLRRQGPRTPPGEAPLLRLVFRCPPILMLDGTTDIWAGATISPSVAGTVTVAKRTWNREDLFEGLAWFLRKYAPKGHPPLTFALNMHSSSEADSWSMKWQAGYVDGHLFAAITPITPLIFPGPTP